jgi:hypothetical protein
MGLLLRLLFNPENGCDMLAKFHRTTRLYIAEDRTLHILFISGMKFIKDAYRRLF